ncbi:MAG TPA: TlpA disulfide reductase family protein [Longimicrobiales bacterium]|nr:TlpA disulfide reductase family protein [Longimicrobiales bacterium]
MVRDAGRRTRLCLTAAVALAASACVEPPGRVAVGERVPSYSARDLEGRSVELRELRGEVVLLNVWATWCFPCRREMPALERLHRELGDRGLRIVAVSIDAASATRDIREFVEEHGLTFDILHDPAQDVTRHFNTIGVPETFLIDAQGRLRLHWLGRIDPQGESVRGAVLDAMASTGGQAPDSRWATTSHGSAPPAQRN